MPKKKTTPESRPESPSISGFKGFDKNLKCMDMQYEIGKEFAMPDGKTIKCCPDNSSEGGLHFVENPLDVFGYYAPADSRYAEVESKGAVDKKEGDSKVATSRLFIKAEVTLSHLIGCGVKFILDRVNFKDAPATNTGYRSAATNTGYRSAATNTGDRSAATNTGDQSAATVEGKESIAIATGFEGKAKGKIGCWIVLAEWQQQKGEWHIIDVKSFPVDGMVVKEDTFYSLKEGKLIEA